ncbi:protein kinase domain-containing protein [Nocardioides sp. AE5]|uniref:serine/threonine-protein kinase n=1 Tax=Nocardioides sp. AE5 TaxID=2962573 RepID=UPI00288221D4|nr:protein kinase [Nocardioides sp. AE5]MDT0203465.1 protein kinase [Nocardioides sp. AE5]
MKRLPISGESFGRYRLARKLGQGGMGVVYAAQDTTLDREVAIKLVNPLHADDPDFRTRFAVEAATLARLDSARIVSIYDHGEVDGVLYIVTQLIDGPDLARLVRTDGPMPPGQALAVLAQVAEGLQDAHAVQVVHRDVKPANVLLRHRGDLVEAFLCDFGIAVLPDVDLSRTGTVAGSLPYMAPERHSGAPAGVSGDIYAVGCMLWHALTGSAPYTGTDVEVAMGHVQGPIPQLPGRGAFTAAVNDLLKRTMAKDPAKRPASAALLHAELVALAASAPDAVTLPGMTSIRHGLAKQPPRRAAWRQAVLASAAVAAVLLGTVWTTSDRGPEPTALGGTAPTSPAQESSDGGDVLGRDASARPTRPGDQEAGARAPLEAASDGLGQGADASTPANPRTSSAPPPAVVTAPGLPPATTTVPAPRQSRFVCWNGASANALSECSNPTGLKGAQWVFGGMSNLKCSKRNLAWTDKEKEAFVCDLGNGNHAYIARWGSVKVARNQLEKHLGTTSNPWSPGNIVYGWKMTKNQAAGKLQFTARIYQGSVVWSVQISAKNKDARAKGLDKVKPFRNPTYLRGRPR